MDWTALGPNPCGDEIFLACPDGPCGLPSLLPCFISEGKKPEAGVKHPPPSSAEVQERAELYVYSPSGPLWPITRRILPSQSKNTLSRPIQSGALKGSPYQQKMLCAIRLPGGICIAQQSLLACFCSS
jgi:hypothetical protein